jgi:RES domain-containing protein
MIGPRALEGFIIASIAFQDSQLQEIDLKALPPNWNAPVAPVALRTFGDDWAADGQYPVLSVPSAVMPGERNYLINPAHPEFAAMKKSSPEPFIFDRRLA